MHKHYADGNQVVMWVKRARKDVQKQWIFNGYHASIRTFTIQKDDKENTYLKSTFWFKEAWWYLHDSNVYIKREK